MKPCDMFQDEVRAKGMCKLHPSIPYGSLLYRLEGFRNSKPCHLAASQSQSPDWHLEQGGNTKTEPKMKAQ